MATSSNLTSVTTAMAVPTAKILSIDVTWTAVLVPVLSRCRHKLWVMGSERKPVPMLVSPRQGLVRLRPQQFSTSFSTSALHLHKILASESPEEQSQKQDRNNIVANWKK
ncbi:hypothetical protein PAXRUDRAFT_419609 [Paxillus rubicundulus Ve08.2h10]|uniref:Uncharacterized protein n=1 Tax=Paxillus rubicundulus Ve08.2h10 TaxID=930991 RepID=A0A0D0DXS3_9AGAM|nr:hypothetical protein PAXRUDRAFT_419609 [Paxillus rubicundulus Ve08.2h10]